MNIDSELNKEFTKMGYNYIEDYDKDIYKEYAIEMLSEVEYLACGKEYTGGN